MSKMALEIKPVDMLNGSNGVSTLDHFQDPDINQPPPEDVAYNQTCWERTTHGDIYIPGHGAKISSGYGGVTHSNRSNK